MLLFQPIPVQWRHGNIRMIRVRYRKVNDVSDGAWNELHLSGSSLSVELPGDASLISSEFYEVTVDAQTEKGFNDSLRLQSVVLPTSASGTSASMQY